MPYPAPVIIVPGITATELRDEYILPPDTVWSAALHKDYTRIALHPDNLRYDAVEPARIMPDHIFEIAYKELMNELRYNLKEKADEPVPVFLFAYDWRQPLELIEKQLGLYVDEVIERTKLLKHYYNDGYANNPKVNLLAHSMGGLIVTGYLQRMGKTSRVAKVATLATPFQGSFEAIVKISTGTSSLGGDAPSSREREFVRLCPSVYQLLPSCDGINVAPGSGLPADIFNPGIWQPSILQTLKEYCRLHTVHPNDAGEQAKTLFDNLLSTAKNHRDRINSFKLEQADLTTNDWLCVVGVDSETRVRVNVKKTGNDPDFDFSSKDMENKWGDGATPKARCLTGDGTVPFDGAIPTFLGLDNIVCVTDDDFGYWEVQDRLLAKVSGFHGILPNMDMLHRLIVRHFTGRDDTRDSTWGRRAPGVAQTKWHPPLPLKDKT
ncbi:MAG: hypothetical protein HQK89_14505 [Nitrospirae bacterium]|nr:hypothetical protein [Nitrospirota bacterium]